MITALVNHPLDKDHPIPLNKGEWEWAKKELS